LPILRWRCAHGEALPVTLASAPCVAIVPLEDTVDTNAAPAVRLCACAGGEAWYEIHFTMTGAGELPRRLDELEQHLAALEAPQR
jgi:hypothetical protein